MGVDKVILRACLTTLAAIGALLLFMFTTLSLFFPSTMMVIAYDMGMESSSIRFAERAYESSEDIYYIAYATEVAIEDKEQDKIISCGEKLIEHEKFLAYCEERGGGYEQLIYRQVSVSKYKAGDGEGAIRLAYDSLKGDFPENNALVAVLMTAIYRTDVTVIEWGVEKLSALQVEGEAATYVNEVLQLCTEVINGETQEN